MPAESPVPLDTLTTAQPGGVQPGAFDVYRYGGRSSGPLGTPGGMPDRYDFGGRGTPAPVMPDNYDHGGRRDRVVPPGGDGVPLGPERSAYLPPRLQQIFNPLPPSGFIDYRAVDNRDNLGNFIRHYGDGQTLAVLNQQPPRIIINNGRTVRELTMNAEGTIASGTVRDTVTGAVTQRPDYLGGWVDGYGSIHKRDGTVERRNNLISPNEQAYGLGIAQGFPERQQMMAGVPGYGNYPQPWNSQYQSCYQQPYRYLPYLGQHYNNNYYRIPHLVHRPHILPIHFLHRRHHG